MLAGQPLSPASPLQSARSSESASQSRGSHRHAKANLIGYHHKSSKQLVTAWPDPRKYNSRSLYLFDLSHPFRRLVIAGRALQFT